MKTLPLLLDEGFEAGDKGEFDDTVVTAGEALTFSREATIHGNYSVLCETAGGPDQYAVVRKFLGGLSVVYTRGYFRIDSGLPLPAEGNRVNFIIYWYAGNVAVCKVNGVDQFQLRVYNPATRGWVVVNSGVAAEVGRVYCVEFAWVAGEVAQLYLDGRLVAEQSLVGLNSNVVDDVRFGLGVTTGANALSVSADSAKIADEYIGPEPEPFPWMVILGALGVIGVVGSVAYLYFRSG